MAAPPEAEARDASSFAVGSEVEVCGLHSVPTLNGLKGRVLEPGTPGRVHVMLENGKEIGLWPKNVAQHSAERDHLLADLIRADVKGEQDEMPLRISRISLRGAGLAEELIRCSRCNDATCSHYVALERTSPLRTAPLKHNELHLCCVDCLIRAAQAARVTPKPSAVRRYIDSCCMGACQACSQLMGHSRAGFGGAFGDTDFY